MARRRQQKTKATGGKTRTVRDAQIYALDVFLLSGPISERFARKNRVISRSIQIRGYQSLEQLHRAILIAFEDVTAIEERPPRGRYPKVTKRVGESPPQYLEEEL